VKVKITKSIVHDAEPVRVAGGVRQALIWDSELPGFGLVVGKSAKTFVAQRDVNGRSVRIKIDRYPVIAVDEARKRAQRLLAKMGEGLDPIAEKRAAKARGIRLGEALDAHEQALKAKRRSHWTIAQYRRMVETYLERWLPRPLIEITRAEVRARHKEIAKQVAAGHYADGREREANGERTANATMVAFRAIWNHTMKVHEALPVSPTIAVDWFKTTTHKAALPVSGLHKWAGEVAKLANPIRRDLLRFMLFSGLRRTNACEARWEHIDLEAGIMHVPKPKSGRPFDLPLSDYLIELLANRKRENAEAFGDCPWVFPSATSASGHIQEPREDFGVIKWSPHDLRRWYVTTADYLDVSPFAIKLLVNHSVPRGDVTAGYLQTEVERLRPVQQMITDQLLVLCGPPHEKVKSLSRLRVFEK